MFDPAALFLADSPDSMSGLILTGLAGCIVMDIGWNNHAKGHAEYCAGLVAFNSLFQVLFLPVYAWLFITWLTSTPVLQSTPLALSMLEVAKAVGLYRACGSFRSGFEVRSRSSRREIDLQAAALAPATATARSKSPRIQSHAQSA